MRRTASPASLCLLGLGVFLLVLAPLLHWYVLPRAEKSPIDIDATTVLTGPGNYFDQQELELSDQVRITATRHTLGNVAESDKNNAAVWDSVNMVDTPETKKLNDPRKSFSFVQERWVHDRHTNLPRHCCGEEPRIDAEAFLKFPFNVERRTYSYWDSTLGGAVDVRYTGNAKVNGHEGYRFSAKVPPTKSGTRTVPGVLVDRPSQSQVAADQFYANEELWLVVDQRTGTIIDAGSSLKVTLRAPGSERDAVTLLQAELIFDEATKKQQVEIAEDGGGSLRLVGTTAPLVAGILGLAAAVAGALLVVRGRVQRPRPQASAPTGPPSEPPAGPHPGYPAGPPVGSQAGPPARG